MGAPGSPPGENLTEVVGANLRRLRAERRLSLEELARVSGVSRSMLSQIELGRSAPTINVLFKIARALEQPFSALLSDSHPFRPRLNRANQIAEIASRDGRFVSRALFTLETRTRAEGYELHLASGGVRRAEPHAPGTAEMLAVSRGTLELSIDGKEHRLATGDTIVFDADVTHTYRNRGRGELVMFLIMTYGR